eukprot:1121246_1
MATLYCAMPHHTGTLFVLPSCLLTACFISPKSQNDGSEVTLENIQYFANAIQFELIGRSHMLTGAPLSYFIKRMYGMPHLTITPWTDATAFIELLKCYMQNIYSNLLSWIYLRNALILNPIICRCPSSHKID